MFFHLREDLRLPEDVDSFEDFVAGCFDKGVLCCRPGEKYECTYIWAGNGVFALSAIPFFDFAGVVFISVEGGFPFIPNCLSKFRNRCVVLPPGAMGEFFEGVERMREALSSRCRC